MDVIRGNLKLRHPDRSFVTAVIVLAVSLLAGHLQAQNLPELAKIKAAAENGDPQAQSKLGNAYFATSEFSEAVKWYRVAAEKGVADAQYRLGDSYLTGRPAMTPGSK